MNCTQVDMMARYLLAISIVLCPTLASAECGTAIQLKGSHETTLRGLRFADGSVAVRAPMAVNPDGAKSSYSVGDHGFTYVANGLASWSMGKRERCDKACVQNFKAAEKNGFGAGTAEFCVFAMEVEPIAKGQGSERCKRGFVIGNGKGRLVLGEMLPTVTGATIQSYVSTTSLKHLENGLPRYLDSEMLPVLVSDDVNMLGKVVVVSGAGFQRTVSVIGDVGPAFGEGSIALHQILRHGKLVDQKLGPIPVSARCGASELSLQAPFQSRPDGGAADRCRSGYTARTGSDIRAYSGIGEKLDYVILGSARYTIKGQTIQDAVSTESLNQLVASGGYTQEKIQAMLACLKP